MEPDRPPGSDAEAAAFPAAGQRSKQQPGADHQGDRRAQLACPPPGNPATVFPAAARGTELRQATLVGRLALSSGPARVAGGQGSKSALSLSSAGGRCAGCGCAGPTMVVTSPVSRSET